MRNVWFAWFNFVCLLFVIYEHMYVAQHTYVVYKLGLLAVPLFAMIAGYAWGGFLKRTHGEGGVYALKMFLLPYLFWVIVYYLLNDIVLDVMIRGRPLAVPSAVRMIKTVFMGSSGVQLYFLSTLIELFFVVILMRKVFKSNFVFNAAVVLVGIAVAVFSVVELPAGSELRTVQEYPCWVVPNLCCGILLATPRAEVYRQGKIKIAAWILFACGLIIHFSVDSHLSSIALVCAIIALTLSHPKVYAPQWLLNTAPYIMGVYLVHALLDAAVSEVWKQFFSGPIPIPVGWIFAVVIFFIAMAVVKLQRKIPFLKNFA